MRYFWKISFYSSCSVWQVRKGLDYTDALPTVSFTSWKPIEFIYKSTVKRLLSIYFLGKKTCLIFRRPWTVARSSMLFNLTLVSSMALHDIFKFRPRGVSVWPQQKVLVYGATNAAMHRSLVTRGSLGSVLGHPPFYFCISTKCSSSEIYINCLCCFNTQYFHNPNTHLKRVVNTWVACSADTSVLVASLTM